MTCPAQHPNCRHHKDEGHCDYCGFDFDADHLTAESLEVAKQEAAAIAQRRMKDVEQAEQVQRDAAERPEVAKEPKNGESDLNIGKYCKYKNELIDLIVTQHASMLLCDNLENGNKGPEMIVVPAGEYEMGTDRPNSFFNSKPAHKVHIGYPFAISMTPVTQAQWKFLMGYNPSMFIGCLDCPVENVSWHEANDFAGKLSSLTGHRYRLPSEAEWEYASKLGGEPVYGRRKYGNRSVCDVNEWYENQPKAETHPVAMSAPSAIWICDMSNNVFEWVEDVWHPDFNSSLFNRVPVDGSAWVKGDKNHRVTKGGTWGTHLVSWHDLASQRGWSNSLYRGGGTGFRLVREL